MLIENTEYDGGGNGLGIGSIVVFYDIYEPICGSGRAACHLSGRMVVPAWGHLWVFESGSSLQGRHSVTDSVVYVLGTSVLYRDFSDCC